MVSITTVIVQAKTAMFQMSLSSAHDMKRRETALERKLRRLFSLDTMVMDRPEN